MGALHTGTNARIENGRERLSFKARSSQRRLHSLFMAQVRGGKLTVVMTRRKSEVESWLAVLSILLSSSKICSALSTLPTLEAWDEKPEPSKVPLILACPKMPLMLLELACSR